MSSQFMRYSKSRRVRVDAFVPFVVVAIASLMVSASANAGSVWPGFKLGDFVGAGASSMSLNITLWQGDAAREKKNHILALVRLSSRQSDVPRLFDHVFLDHVFDDAKDDAPALRSNRMNERIMHGRWVLRRRFSTGRMERTVVPEPGSALMLGLGMIAFAVRGKRARLR